MIPLGDVERGPEIASGLALRCAEDGGRCSAHAGMEITESTATVTGANRGIGRHFVEQLLARHNRAQ